MSFPTVKIIHQLRQFRRQHFSVTDLLTQLSLDRDMRRSVIKFLDQMVVDGLLKHMRRGRYMVRQPLILRQGVLKRQAAGHAFVVDEQGDDELYIASYRLGGAMDGDRISALELPGQRGSRPEGWVVSIVERGQETVLGCCEKHSRSGQLLFRSEQIGMEFEVEGASEPETLVGQVVVLRIDRYPSPHQGGSGHIVDVLGPVGSPEVDILMTAHRLGIPTAFSAAALQQAQQAASVDVAVSVDDRIDYGRVPFVTIDGEDAKDFDDAVALRQLDGGNWLLQVAIADVSYYVAEGTVLDREARERGTSVYFPGRCLPMLPEVLSNGMCSLNPGQPRLVMVAELEFTPQGERCAVKIQRGVIRSRQRLTYRQVQHHLDGEADSGVDAAVAEMIGHMAQLADRLRQLRLQRGALDFDLPEADITLNAHGVAQSIGRRPRLAAHRLIEEFMLAANEAVAEFVLQHCRQGMFRVHDAPDQLSLQSFQQYIASFNLGFNLDPGGVSHHELRRLLEQVEGTDVEYAVNRILLRSMKQARYDAENLGHFGLASEAYCHFTSPIRRYPDLVQHRLLVSLLTATESWRPDQPFDVLAEQATLAERRAMQAERDIVDLRKCQFMADKIGLQFTGFITSVTAFGFFVELDEYFVEGLVHIRQLSDDYYTYDEDQHSLTGQARRRVFRVGMPVTVELWQVRAVAREIDFILPELAREPKSAPRRRVGRRKRW